MKKNLTILLVIFSFSLRSQVISVSSDSPEFAKMMKSTTVFVLLGDTAYDNGLKRAADKYWKFTKFDFVNLKDLDNHIADESKSFLLPLVMIVSYVHDKIGNNWDKKMADYSKTKCWLTVIVGGKKSVRKYSDSDPLAISPFNYYGDENDVVKCAYRLDYMVKGINDGFEFCQQKQLTGGYLKMVTNSTSEINKGIAKILAKKTLVINNTKYNRVSEDAFTDAPYPYKTKFVSDDEFKTIMRGNNPEYVCLVPAYEVNKHIMICDPSTKKTIYYHWSMQGLKVTKKDVKEFTDQAN